MRSRTASNFAAALCISLLSVTLLAAPPSKAAVADAAKRGDRDQVRLLLKDGADVSGAHGDGMSALHWAAERGDAETAAMLIYAGANVEAVTRIGAYTPLHLASKLGSTAVVEALLKAGASITARSTNSGVTPLHFAATSGDPDVVSLLIGRGADVNARESEWGQTPLIFASSQNRVGAIKVLLARGADPRITSKTVDLVAHGALDRAARERQRKVLESVVGKDQQPTPSQVQAAIQASRELFASGKVPPPEKREGEGNAANTGTAATPFNPEEINPPVSNKGGLTALLHAARQGHLDAARTLVDGGAPIDQVSDGEATSPLLIAIINGQFDVAMFLIERGANVNLAANGNGATPLWAAVNTQWQPRTRFPQPQQMELQGATYLDVAKALLDAGADPDARLKSHPWYMVYSGCGNRNCGLADTAGSTAFWRAAYAVDVDAMRLLVQYGADPNIATIAPPAPRQRGPQGGAPGQDGAGAPATRAPAAAPATGPAPAPSSGEAATAPAAMMPTEAAAPTEAAPPPPPPVPHGGRGALPLHAAAGVEYGEGFAGNAHRHAPGGWMPAVQYLVEELGADVNARDNDGYTALHHAAARGDNEMILYLVEKGADVTAVSRSGQTTADMANGPVQRVSPFPETVALLMKLGSKNNNRCVSC